MIESRQPFTAKQGDTASGLLHKIIHKKYPKQKVLFEAAIQ